MPREIDDERIIMWHEVRDSYITVLAHGEDSRLDETGRPLSIIGAGEIGRVQGPDITRILERFPGVSLSRNGGDGGFTAMRVRGAEGEQLLVLVDGVRVADSAAPGGGFDFGTMLPAGIGKIELLRGSNSTIWGSQAMGGVLALSSGRGWSGLSVEYGGPDTVYASGRADLPIGPVTIGLDAAFRDGEGISSAAAGSEQDGFRQWQGGARAEVPLAEDWRIFAGLRHVDALLEIDGFPAPDFVLADTGEFQEIRRTFGHAGLGYSGDRLELSGTFSLSDTQRDSFDPEVKAVPSYATAGRTERAEMRGAWSPQDPLTVHFGAEREWSRFSTLVAPEQGTASHGEYVQLGLALRDISINAGLRRDDHEAYGGEWSFGADGAFRLGGGWRIRASYGEGFRAPSLFQLLSDYGNAALRPERSRSWDIGIEQGDRNLDHHLAFSLFRRDSEDLIDFVSCLGAAEGICAGRPFGTYDNVAAARAQGLEAEAGWNVTDFLTLRGVYSYVEATNRAANHANQGNDLARRPRHSATISLDWSRHRGVSLGADMRVVSGSFDDADNLVRLDGYAVLTLRGAVEVSDRIELFGRIENAWDEQYQTVAGYGTQGRAAWIGARSAW